MSVNIVTGRRGEVHVTSDDDKARNAEAFGKGKFVLDVGKYFKTTVDGRQVTLSDGMCMSYGTQMGIERDDTETVNIDAASFGYVRHDIIAMRYTRDLSQDLEQAEIVVIKGNAVQQNPQDPTCVDGNILTGATLDETPLWRVVVSDTTITAIEPLAILRNGNINTGDPGGSESGEENPYIINAAAIDRIWGSSLEDGDGEEW